MEASVRATRGTPQGPHVHASSSPHACSALRSCPSPLVPVLSEISLNMYTTSSSLLLHCPCCPSSPLSMGVLPSHPLVPQLFLSLFTVIPLHISHTAFSLLPLSVTHFCGLSLCRYSLPLLSVFLRFSQTHVPFSSSLTPQRSYHPCWQSSAYLFSIVMALSPAPPFCLACATSKLPLLSPRLAFLSFYFSVMASSRGSSV